MATKSRVSELPKSSKNQFQMVPEALLGIMWDPKSIPDGTRSFLEDYVGPLIEKNLIFNSQKVRRSQNVMKFEINFKIFSFFFRFYLSTNFGVIFRGSGPDKKWFSLRQNINFCKLTFSKKTKNHQFWDAF